MEAPQSEEWKQRLREYVLEHGDSLEFTKYFWKGCEPIEAEVIQYHKFTSSIQSIAKGWSVEEIASEVDASKSSVRNWKNLFQMPKFGHFLKAFIILGSPPAKEIWLTTECSHGHGVPVGDFVRAPLCIDSWNDVSRVLEQLQDRNESQTQESRLYTFGFLVGILMGDANKYKSPHGASHRHIDLVLSKKYETNLRIGEYTCVCARSIGLRMERGKNLPKPADKPNGFMSGSPSLLL